MFKIGGNIFHRPFYFFLKNHLPGRAFLFAAYWAGKIEAAVRVYEHFDAFAKAALYQFSDFVNFEVRFVHVQVPGQSEV